MPQIRRFVLEGHKIIMGCAPGFEFTFAVVLLNIDKGQ